MVRGQRLIAVSQACQAVDTQQDRLFACLLVATAKGYLGCRDMPGEPLTRYFCSNPIDRARHRRVTSLELRIGMATHAVEPKRLSRRVGLGIGQSAGPSRRSD
jgi:hypothetical protein